jgi:hypothetical protein
MRNVLTLAALVTMCLSRPFRQLPPRSMPNRTKNARAIALERQESKAIR